MSKDNKDKDQDKDKKPEDYEVGYGKPPKHSRFKPGRSGNPRGPKPRIPRAEIESQIGKDLRRILRDTVTVNGEDISIMEALLKKAVHSALKDNRANLRYVIDLAAKAYRENAERKPDIRLIDAVDFERILRKPELRNFWIAYLKELAKLSEEP